MEISEIGIRFEAHKLWLDTAGEQGERLSLDGQDMKSLTEEEIKSLANSFMIECRFENMKLLGTDLFHSELFSCDFTNACFNEVSFEKSELNYITFSKSSMESVSFHNAEIYDCDFTAARLINADFAGVSIWNSNFKNSRIISADFAEADLCEILVDDSTSFETPVNLDSAHLITLNIGSAESPDILTMEQSLEWIRQYTVMS